MGSKHFFLEEEAFPYFTHMTTQPNITSPTDSNSLMVRSRNPLSLPPGVATSHRYSHWCRIASPPLSTPQISMRSWCGFSSLRTWVRSLTRVRSSSSSRLPYRLLGSSPLAIPKPSCISTSRRTLVHFAVRAESSLWRISHSLQEDVAIAGWQPSSAASLVRRAHGARLSACQSAMTRVKRNNWLGGRLMLSFLLVISFAFFDGVISFAGWITWGAFCGVMWLVRIQRWDCLTARGSLPESRPPSFVYHRGPYHRSNCACNQQWWLHEICRCHTPWQLILCPRAVWCR